MAIGEGSDHLNENDILLVLENIVNGHNFIHDFQLPREENNMR